LRSLPPSPNGVYNFVYRNFLLFRDRKLTTLDVKLDYVIEKLNSMETLLQQFMKSKSQTPTTVCRKSAFPPHIHFPIENLKTFNELELLLGNSEEAKQYLVRKLLIGIAVLGNQL
jgi:hypothetical protein